MPAVKTKTSRSQLLNRIIQDDLVIEAATIIHHTWKSEAKKEFRKPDLRECALKVINDAFNNGFSEETLFKLEELVSTARDQVCTLEEYDAFLKLLDKKAQISELESRIREIKKDIDGYDEKATVMERGETIKKKIHVDGLKEIVDRIFGVRYRLILPGGEKIIWREYNYCPPFSSGDYSFFKYKIGEVGEDE